MKIGTLLAAVGLTSLLLAGAAQAASTTITFDGLSGAAEAPFTGPYTEGGFSVSLDGGQVFQLTFFGDPAPSLIVGLSGSVSNGTVSVTDGGSNFSLT